MTPIQILLVDGWSSEQRSAVYKKFKRLNPGEASKAEAYWAAGGAPPQMYTFKGRALIKYAKARWT